MPFFLKESEIGPQVAGLESVLIVPCEFCPAASLAVRENKPYIELFRKFLKTEAYQEFIQCLKRRLEDQGVKTAVFVNKLPHHFVTCMWTSGRRSALAKRAAEFDGVIVLGCDSAVQTVRDAVASSGCRVIQGMEAESMINVAPKVRFPFNITLEVQSTPPIKAQVH